MQANTMTTICQSCGAILEFEDDRITASEIVARELGFG